MCQTPSNEHNRHNGLVCNIYRPTTCLRLVSLTAIYRAKKTQNSQNALAVRAASWTLLGAYSIHPDPNKWAASFRGGEEEGKWSGEKEGMKGESRKEREKRGGPHQVWKQIDTHDWRPKQGHQEPFRAIQATSRWRVLSLTSNLAYLVK